MQQVLWEISYANITMLLATIPTYESTDKKTADSNKAVPGEADSEEKTIENLFNSDF